MYQHANCSRSLHSFSVLIGGMLGGCALGWWWSVVTHQGFKAPELLLRALKTPLTPQSHGSGGGGDAGFDGFAADMWSLGCVLVCLSVFV